MKKFQAWYQAPLLQHLYTFLILGYRQDIGTNTKNVQVKIDIKVLSKKSYHMHQSLSIDE